jgi:thiamine-phosphate pyrophosphorylase
VKFLVNDDPILSKKLNADGCHLGQKDMDIKNARKIIGNKIIGITCHNSIKLAKAAIKNKASYIAFGAFFQPQLKK